MESVFRLTLRSRIEQPVGSEEWQEVMIQKELPAARTALLLCDVWDRHWCPSAAARVNEMAPAIDTLVSLARSRGAQIIHAPSDTLDFYAESPHRLKTTHLPRMTPPEPLPRTPEPSLPIDASDGGCDALPETIETAVNTKVWTRQHSTIEIIGEDVISDNGAEIYRLLRSQQRDHLLLIGVHANMCLLERSFGIRQMTRWGIDCILIRDLTDSMYNPAKAPFVDHFTGTERVIEHIEKYWCATTTSADITGGLPFRFNRD